MRIKLSILILCVASVLLATYVVFAKPASQEFTGTKWEYLTLDYSQLGSFDPGIDGTKRYEIVLADKVPYKDTFIQASYGDCKSDDDACKIALFKGREYYLDLLGADGWEMIAFNNLSSQYTYQVEMIFKRPIP